MKSLRLDMMGAVVAIAVGLGLTYFFIGRGLQEWQRQRSELRALSAEVESLTQLSTALQNASATLAQASEQEMLAGRVPRQVELDTFFQQLQTQAQQRQVRIQRMQHEQVVDVGDLDALPIRISAIGPLDGLYHLLGDMRNAKRLVKFEQVSMLATEDPGACEMQLVLRIYSAAAPEPVVEPGA